MNLNILCDPKLAIKTSQNVDQIQLWTGSRSYSKWDPNSNQHISNPQPAIRSTVQYLYSTLCDLQYVCVYCTTIVSYGFPRRLSLILITRSLPFWTFMVQTKGFDNAIGESVETAGSWMVFEEIPRPPIPPWEVGGGGGGGELSLLIHNSAFQLRMVPSLYKGPLFSLCMYMNHKETKS